jgi:glycosyltransferase involved in cell wall biosynthesis
MKPEDHIEGEHPAVSYVVPVLNEEATIWGTVASIMAQDYPGESEVVLVHGPSTDATGEVLRRIVAEHSNVRVLDNGKPSTPVSMNAGIAHTSNPLIVRVDAHASLPPDYTSRMVQALLEHDAVNVGGRMLAKGSTPFQRAVAWAYNSPYGLGGGVHHRDTGAGPAETAYLGVFRRTALVRVGGYDDALTRAQDWELNKRLREDGGVIWFEPDVPVDYYPRANFRSLVKQFWGSGRWRGMLMRADFAGSPLRYFAPAALVIVHVLAALMVVTGTVLAITGQDSGLSIVAAAVVLPLCYLVAVVVVAATASSLAVRDRANLAVVLPTMHFSWGAGNALGMLRPPVRSSPKPSPTPAAAPTLPVAVRPEAAEVVSFVMPVLNEEAYVRAAVESIAAQQGVTVDEIILVLGNSTDGTDQIVTAMAAEDPRIRVLRNPRNSIPVSLNIGMQSARNAVVVRVDAHSVLAPDYTATMVASLRENSAVNVGGRMRAKGLSVFGAAVAWAYNSPAGLGGGVYHLGGEAGPAESAYLGVFLREAVLAVGGFDESLARGEDWELNQRLIAQGGTVWFDPRVEVVYRPRDTLRALAKQFVASGRWRGELIRRDPRNAGIRYLVPPMLVVALVASLVLCSGALVGGDPVQWPLLGIGLATPVLYGAFQLAAVLRATSIQRPARLLLLAVLPVMHTSWGAGCLLGLVVPSRGDNAFAGR